MNPDEIQVGSSIDAIPQFDPIASLSFDDDAAHR